MKKIWSIFDKPTKIEFIFLTVMLTFNTVLETISISLLIPICILNRKQLFNPIQRYYFYKLFSRDIFYKYH